MLTPTLLALLASQTQKSIAPVSFGVKPKLVTTGYIRQNSPDAFARIVSIGGANAKLARPFELKAVKALNIRTNAYQPATKPVFTAESKVNSGKAPDKIIPLKVKKSEDKPSNIFLTYFNTPKEEYDFAADYGDVVAGNTSTGHYDGVASKTGVLTVTPVTGGPMVPHRILVFSGEWKNGKPDVVGFDMIAPFSVKVKAGQEYRVEYRLDTKKLALGSYKGQSTIDDGNLIHVKFSAKVVEPSGGFNYTFSQTSGVELATGQEANFSVTVNPNGTSSSTDFRFKVLNRDELEEHGVEIDYPDLVGVANGDNKVVKFQLRGREAADYQGTILLEISAYGGKTKVLSKVPVSLKTMWLDSGPMPITAGDVNCTLRLRINSLGGYDFSWNATNNANLTRYVAYMFIFPESPLDNGKRWSLYTARMLFAQYLPGPSSAADSETGESSILRKQFFKLASGGFKGYLGLDGYGIDQLKNEWRLVGADGYPYSW